MFSGLKRYVHLGAYLPRPKRIFQTPDGLQRWLMERPENTNLPAPITVIIVLMVVAAALVSPRLAGSNRLPLLIIGGIGGVAGLLVLQRRPALGLIALSPVALMVKYSLGTGSQTGINAAVLLIVLLVGLWLLEMLTGAQRINLMKHRSVTAALVMCAVAAVAFGFGQFQWFPMVQSAPLRAQLGGLGIFILSAAVLLLYAHRVSSINDLKWITAVFIACGTLYILMRVIPGLERQVLVVFVREAGQGVVFYIWLACIGVAQLLLNSELSRWKRAVIVIMLLGMAYQNLVVSRAWVSGWLPPLAGVGLVILLSRPKLGALLLFFGAAAAILFSSAVTGIFSEGDNAYSTLTRLEAWKILWEIIRVNPVFGLGMANYYWYTPLYSILGYRVNFNSHNNYIDIIAQTGVIGLAAFLWLFWELWRDGWQLLPRVKDGFERAYVIGALGGLVGSLAAAMLGDWVMPFVYNIGIGGFRASLFTFMFLGGMLAVARINAARSGESAEGRAG